MKEKIKKHKKLFSIIGVFLAIFVAGTIAYFSLSDEIENVFNAGTYSNEMEEVFTSPEDWEPGDTTPKTLSVKNTGSICQNVRISVSELWKDSQNRTIANTQNGESAAIINLANKADWVKSGNYYYYKRDLLQNQTASSFLSSVTFNENVSNSFTCTNGECNSTGAGYDDATYTLTFHVETVQCSKVEDVWGVVPSELVNQYIRFVNRQNNNSITVGDEIAIDTEHFYIVSSNSTETVALAKYNLYTGIVHDIDANGNRSLNKTLSSEDEGFGLQNSNAVGFVNKPERPYQIYGIVPFVGKSYWSSRCNGTYPCNVYDSSLSTIAPSIAYDSYSHYYYARNTNDYAIAYYVAPYKSALVDMGASELLNVRLLTYSEAISLGCRYNQSYNDCNNAPSWILNTSFWTGTAYDYSATVYGVSYSGMFAAYSANRADSFGARPVIVFPTSHMPN